MKREREKEKERENPKTKTPLLVAAENGALETIRILVLLGADVNQNFQGFTPLHSLQIT